MMIWGLLLLSRILITQANSEKNFPLNINFCHVLVYISKSRTELCKCSAVIEIQG